MKYFAYGSNMDSERMSERSIRFSQRTHATLKGCRLDFNKVASRNPQEGYANVVKFENGIVEGVRVASGAPVK
jgi:gamma-glutamylcyclotransferase